MWLFGDVQRNIVHLMEDTCASGYLDLKRARVRWFLSLDEADLPPSASADGKRTYRSLKIDGKEFKFSDGFTDLHTRSYKEILAGRGFGLADVRPSIQVAHDIRNTRKAELTGDYHPLAASRENRQ